MISPKSLRSHQLLTLFKLLNPNSQTEIHLIPSIYTKSLIPNSIFNRSISLSAQFQQEFATKSDDVKKSIKKPKKPLEAFFTEAVGLSKKRQESDIEDGENENELKKRLRKLEEELRRDREDSKKEVKTFSGVFSKPLETVFTEAVGLSKKSQESDIDDSENDDQDLKKKLRKLEMELGKDRVGSEKQLKTLSGLFTDPDRRERSRKESPKMEMESMDFKELSPDMVMFAKFLHRKGYLKTANFLPNNKFDVSCFENKYGHDYLKFAAEKFAKDHREIGKWLPGNDLKKVAQFGCPSLGRKNIFSAKSMRIFYGIQEPTVCSKCVLKQSCKFANQSIWKKGAKNMDLTVVMRVITLYALEAVPPQLEVPDDVKNAVNGLLKEVVRLAEIES